MFLMVYWREDFIRKKLLIRIALIFPTIVFLAYFGLFATGKLDYYMNSDKYLLESIKAKNKNTEIQLYYWNDKNYSGQFYSNGNAKVLKTSEALDSVLKLKKKILFVIPTVNEQEIPKAILGKMTLSESNFKTSIFETK